MINPKKLIAFIFSYFFLIAVNAQSYKKTAVGIRAQTDSLLIEVQFFSPSIIRVIKGPLGHTISKEGLSVIMNP